MPLRFMQNVLRFYFIKLVKLIAIIFFHTLSWLSFWFDAQFFWKFKAPQFIKSSFDSCNFLKIFYLFIYFLFRQTRRELKQWNLIIQGKSEPYFVTRWISNESFSCVLWPAGKKELFISHKLTIWNKDCFPTVSGFYLEVYVFSNLKSFCCIWESPSPHTLLPCLLYL